MPFQELRLAEPIVRAVASQGYTTPTPIQTKAIPAVLSGRDVLGCAQTGTGKTGAFAMPMLHRLAEQSRPSRPAAKKPPQNRDHRRGGRDRRPMKSVAPRALVLSPTRELATQIHESFCTYGRHVPLRHVVIFGGVSQYHQVKAMRGGVDVLVATPGRLLDLMQQGIIDVSAIETLVLDEADHMLDMGFLPDIKRIIGELPRKRQTLFFSATMPNDIRTLADSILVDPVSLQTERVASTVEMIDQTLYMVPHRHKPTLLKRQIDRQSMSRTLVFTRTKRGADRLAEKLQRSGVEADAIHGNKNQNARTRALNGFKSGATPVLVATDIAARGIDVSNVTHVVNYDIPKVSETYIHRVGRTGRAGAGGMAISLCDRDERRDVRSIERLIKRELQVIECDADLQDGKGGSNSGSGNQSRRGGGSGSDHRRSGNFRSTRRSSERTAPGSKPRPKSQPRWQKDDAPAKDRNSRQRSGEEQRTTGGAPWKKKRATRSGAEGRTEQRQSRDDQRPSTGPPWKKKRKAETDSRSGTTKRSKQRRPRQEDGSDQPSRNRWLNRDDSAAGGDRGSRVAKGSRPRTDRDSSTSTPSRRRATSKSGNTTSQGDDSGKSRKTWGKKSSGKGRRKTTVSASGRGPSKGKRKTR